MCLCICARKCIWCQFLVIQRVSGIDVPVTVSVTISVIVPMLHDHRNVIPSSMRGKRRGIRNGLLIDSSRGSAIFIRRSKAAPGDVGRPQRAGDARMSMPETPGP